jgi:hypothetical protein
MYTVAIGPLEYFLENLNKQGGGDEENFDVVFTRFVFTGERRMVARQGAWWRDRESCRSTGTTMASVPKVK